MLFADGERPNQTHAGTFVMTMALAADLLLQTTTKRLGTGCRPVAVRAQIARPGRQQLAETPEYLCEFLINGLVPK